MRWAKSQPTYYTMTYTWVSIYFSHIKSALSCLFTLGLDVSKVFRKIGRLTRQLHLYHQVALEVVMLRTSMLEVLTAAATTMIEGVN